MYIKRNLEGTILKYLNAREIIAITGARQTGKTTMINHLIKNFSDAVSVSFDDQNILRMFESQTDDFINIYIKGNKYLFIDEFQYARNGGKILKYIFDSQKIKIIISGSSAIDLSVRAVKYLVGRVLIFNLYPFDFQEFLSAKDKNYLKIYKENRKLVEQFKDVEIKIGKQAHKKLLYYYEEYLLFGGYPRVVLEDNHEAKKELLRNIYNTYFLREVRDILGLIDDYKLNNLTKALALQIGNLLDYQELSQVSGYSYPSLKKYLNFLEKTYICRFLRPYFKNRRTEIVKNPKVYFLDTGLRNFIVDDFRKLDTRPDKGLLLENGLAQQFIKNDYKFNFWRDKKKNEIDFIIFLGNGKTIAIESKAYLKTRKFGSIEFFKKRYPDIDVYLSYQDINQKIIDRARIYPVYFY
ncbi:ATP-binding protein [Patescibacteria group bacterium]|nr:ATP-binding protein [Patescibacteria group bacterium]